MKRKAFIILLLMLFMVSLVSACGSSDSKFLGEWVDVKNNKDTAKVYKNGDSYIWEDKDGKYPAVIKDDMLRISVGMGEVVATYDEKENLLVARFMGTEYKFKRK